MLTVLDDDSSHERGYFAGVDDYLSKRAPDAKIVAAIRAAFRAVEMRQALHAVRQQQGAGLVSDVASGVLADRMRAEVKRAARYGRNLSVLVMQLQSESGAPVAADTMARAVHVVSDSIRVDIDFATRYRGLDGVQRIAVLLPETNAAGAGWCRCPLERHVGGTFADTARIIHSSCRLRVVRAGPGNPAVTTDRRDYRSAAARSGSGRPSRADFLDHAAAHRSWLSRHALRSRRSSSRR